MVLQKVSAIGRNGENIGRLLMNEEIACQVRLSGTVLDIGGKGMPSYRRLFDHRPIYCMDLIWDRTIDAAGSIVHLPLSDQSCDVILCFNVLEHVFEFKPALQELRRVLKPGGTLYGRVPFLLNVHGDPHDYWRYTRETLNRLLAQAGYREIQVIAHGGLFLVLLNLLDPLLRPRWLKALAAIPFLLLDRLLAHWAGSERNRERFPLGYFFIAR